MSDRSGFAPCQCGGNLVLKRSVRKLDTLEWVRCSACGRSEPRALRRDGEIVERGRKALAVFEGET